LQWHIPEASRIFLVLRFSRFFGVLSDPSKMEPLKFVIFLRSASCLQVHLKALRHHRVQVAK